MGRRGDHFCYYRHRFRRDRWQYGVGSEVPQLSGFRPDLVVGRAAIGILANPITVAQRRFEGAAAYGCSA